MFAYLSLLVEQGHFDEIQVNFLIVGHTHTTIDQYFSVITKQLYGKFVGSPLSLQHLFNECQKPMVNKQIFAQYDYRSWLQPIINELHNYSLPHVFIFKRRVGKAVCQHKPYSRSPRFFPVEPDQIPKDNAAFKSLLRPLRLDHLSFIGGIESIQNTIGINDNISTKALSTGDTQLFDQIKLLNDLIKPLRDIEAKVSCEINNKMELQSEVGYLTTLTEDNLAHKVIDLTNLNDDEILGPDSDEDEDGDNNKARSSNSNISKNISNLVVDDPSLAPNSVTREQLTAFSRTLDQFNYEEMGYLVWLDYDKINDEWFNSSPRLLDYSSDVSRIISKLYY